MPLSGKVLEVNAALADDPASVNKDPYGEGWLVRIKISDSEEIEGLLSAEQYEESIG